jgi:hypothetical protein
MFRKLHHPAGIIITALLSLAVLSAFYGNLFNKLNRVCFASGGDGMQSYVNMEYHIRYDSSYLRCNSMNYPYGEHVFFTNNQPPVSNTIKFISDHFVDISGYTLGILNFLMLFCLVITPVILYLILTDAGTGRILASLAAVGITYLSPQLDRFGGHFNLAYVCAIPLMILLLTRFFRRPTVLLSIAITLTVMAGALTHFYLYGFFALLLLFFYGDCVLNKRAVFSKNYGWIIHLFLQLVLPFLILQAFYISDHVTDRTAHPWGFLYYRAYPQSIFLPLNKPYGRFLHHYSDFSYIDWEGYAYIGLLAVAATVFYLARMAKKFTHGAFRDMGRVTPNAQLNVLFWAAAVALLYSFGLPFILGLQGLVDYTGPLQQMRGIARFSWVFFYVMNIMAVYGLWEAWKSGRRKIPLLVIMVLSVMMLFYDAYYNVRGRGRALENIIPALTDRRLVIPDNQWIRHIDISRYQAMIPLPYFHVGSENIWLDGGCDIIPQSFITLARSGLPSLGVMLSRTSLSQTVENVGLMLEPSPASVNMERFPNEKPFLLMAARCKSLTLQERRLIWHAAWLDSSGVFDLYALPFRAFQDIYDSLALAAAREFREPELFGDAGMKSTDSVLTYRYLYTDSLFTGVAKHKNILFSGPLPNSDTSRLYMVSFWMDNVRTDLYPRTRIILAETNEQGIITWEESSEVSKHFVMINGSRVLVEYTFRISHPAAKISISLENKSLGWKLLRVDNLLIKPEKTNLYRQTGDGIWKNNRFYPSDQSTAESVIL